jgi:hypothetical protein
MPTVTRIPSRTQPGQHLLWKVPGLVGDLPEVGGPAQHGHLRQRQNCRQATASAASRPPIVHLSKDPQ